MADHNVAGDEILRLKAELSKALQREKTLQAQLHSSTSKSVQLESKSASANLAKCPLLDTLPLEIRRQIYRNLLVNPIVGTKESVIDNFGAYTKYGLAPEILVTCRQINEEATSILYGSTPFFIECTQYPPDADDQYPTCYCCSCGKCNCSCQSERSFVYDTQIRGHLNCSPLTRHWNKYGVRNSFMTLEQLPAFQKVRNWKVVTSTNRCDGYERYYPSWDLRQFCQAIYSSAPKSIQILLVPPTENMQQHLYQDYTECTLFPLRYLRNVGSLNISAASPRDVTDPGSADPEFTFNDGDLPSPELSKELQLVATGTSPVELMFQMQRSLVRYAQSFERFEPFQLHMEIPLSMEIHESFGPEHDEKYRLSIEIWNYYRNTELPVHPVEEALSQSILAAGSDNMTEFKEQRTIVVEYLEPQYRQIVIFAGNINGFIK